MTRREYHRQWARRRQARKLNVARFGRRTCPRGNGGAPCGGVLEIRTDGRGDTRTICPRCERRWAGICQDCPAKVAGAIGKALRCARCKRVARTMYTERYRVRNPEEYRESSRRYHADQAIRDRKAAYLRQWRKLNPEMVKAQHRRSTLRGVNLRAQKRRREQLKAAGLPLGGKRYDVRTCLTCPTIVRGRVKKCTLCREHDRLTADSVLAPRRGRGRRTDLEKVA